MSEKTNNIVANLRQRHANVTGNDPRITNPIVGATIFQEAADEIERLHARVRFLEKRIGDASFMLFDWDGHYNPDKKQGNVEELAKLVEDAFTTLQGRSWLLPEDEYNSFNSNDSKENTND